MKTKTMKNPELGVGLYGGKDLYVELGGLLLDEGGQKLVEKGIPALVGRRGGGCRW